MPFFDSVYNNNSYQILYLLLYNYNIHIENLEIKYSLYKFIIDYYIVMEEYERLKNIENLENIFNELELSLKDMKKSFKKWKSLHPKFKKLMDYYSSDQRKKDYDDVNNRELEPKWPHWILSEDAIYNFYENQREFYEEMIRFINKVYK